MIIGSRTQAGLEYLMTYGWVLLLIMVIVSVLFFVFSPLTGQNANFSVSSNRQIPFKTGSVGPDGKTKILMQNAGGEAIEIKSITAPGFIGTPKVNGLAYANLEIDSGQQIEITDLTAICASGSFIGSINIAFQGEDGFTRIATVLANGKCISNASCTQDDQCNDSQACTTDSCVSGTCNHAVLAPCCGNGTCESLETCSNCQADCGCVSPKICTSGVCAVPVCTPSDCHETPTDNACTIDTCVSGTCTHTEVTCINNDSCCPSGCNSGNDNDCVPVITCNNNGECNDSQACTTDICNNPGQPTSSCSHNLISSCINSDGCCPTGCNSGNDNDCSPAIACNNNGECNDSNSCTTDICNSPGQPTSSCSHNSITICAGSDGCCPSGCTNPLDTDCAVDSALLAYYKFNGTINDEVGGNNGTFYGGTPSYVAGKIGQALSFDGIDDYADAGTMVPDEIGYGNFTFSGWVKYNSIPGSELIAIPLWMGSNINGGFLVGFRLESPYGASRVLYSSWYDLFGLATGSDSTDGVWYHVASTYDGSNHRFYVNGVLRETVPYTESLIASGHVYFGSVDGSEDGVAGDYPFNGAIDEVRIYNRALTDGEIAALYSAGGSGSSCSVPSDCGSDPCKTYSCTGGECSSTDKTCGPSDGCCLGGCTNPPDTDCILDSSLKAYYKFDGTVNDETGSNNGTFYGGTPGYLAGKTGQALAFNGTGNYVSIGDKELITNAFTISFWVNPSVISGVQSYPVSKYAAVTNGRAYSVFFDGSANNLITLNIGNGATAYQVAAVSGLSSLVPVSQWTNIAWTRTNSTVALYVNGLPQTLSQNDITNINIPNVTTPLVIGAGVNTRYFNGLIDGVRIYNRALTAGEIMSLYSSAERCQNNGECNDGQSCTIDMCNNPGQPTSSCSHNSITSCTSSDSCCPSGCTNPPDSDCPLNSALLAYYKFDGTVNDETGNNNGLFQGGTPNYVAGKHGQALTFDPNTNNCVGVDSVSSAIASGGLSVAAWIKFPANYGNGSAVQLIFRLGDDPSSNDMHLSMGEFFGATDGKLHFSFFNGADWLDIVSSRSSWTANAWYLIVGTYDGSTSKLYINDQLEGQAGGVSRGPIASTHAMIGYSYNSVGPVYFSGQMDDFQIYNRALTAGEIAALYSAG